jgi:hypothetical protein
MQAAIALQDLRHVLQEQIPCELQAELRRAA